MTKSYDAIHYRENDNFDNVVDSFNRKYPAWDKPNKMHKVFEFDEITLRSTNSIINKFFLSYATTTIGLPRAPQNGGYQ